MSMIRFRLPLMFVVLVLLPALIISASTVWFGLQGGKRQIYNQLQSVATLKEAEIKTWIANMHAHLATTIYSHDVPDLLDPLFQRHPDDPAYRAAYAEIHLHFERAIAHSDLFEEIFFMDTEGRVMVSTDRTREGNEHSFQRYFWHGLKQPYVESLSSSTYQARNSVVTVRPVLDEEGRTRGVLAGRASSSRLNQIMRERAGLGATGETYLVGANAVLLTEARFADPNQQFLRVRTRGVEEALQTQENGYASYLNYQHMAVFGVYHYLPEVDMVLLAEQGQREAFAATYTILIFNSVIALLAVMVAVAAGLVLARNIAVPLKNLSETASRIAAGDLELRAKEEYNNEIGVLSQAFNSMTTRLRSLIDNLEQRVAELDEAQAEISEARDIAESANHAKSAFLANMSHELRTPLNAIIGYSEMLQEDAEDMGNEDFVTDIVKIRTAGQHLLSLISDILDLSKIEAGKMELHLERFHIQELIEHVTTTIRPMAEKNTNTFTVECSRHLGEMVADETRVRQVLLNLLSNAAKFTHEGTITLTVERFANVSEQAFCAVEINAYGELAGLQPIAPTAEPASDGNNGREPEPLEWIIFQIRDTGIGMSPAQTQNLFQPFMQGDASTTRKYGGTGLGLAISQRLCHMMGGAIVVESREGEGSVFTVQLPASHVAIHSH
jgi:signal transduction histidine kinase